jgi:hypothetical protein
LTTSSTDHLSFDRKIQSQNQMLRLIPLVELTYGIKGRFREQVGRERKMTAYFHNLLIFR